ncbi:LacI family DNA-binding transcriptional regulator [Hydrogenophaga sp. PAMC20947]|uniref:LacI family DNA-binding transcriptional regulator n=1 Tax=Hydrogenophaga sp. PAMC20947 TaxID=2565558 RepID=UPI001FF9E9C2|nr:LacI family DNA-binding transcriptional regulator [Hydrogenophaga sp. PAMC20947]
MKNAAPSPPLAKATIADVARTAGVSKATVSRFLNHRDRLLSKDIATRVEVAIAALGYSPSPMAQALKRGRTKLIGLVVADASNPFSIALLRGAEKVCQQAGYLIMLFNLADDDTREQEAIEALSTYQVEGFILNTLGHDGGAAANAMSQGKPVVLIDRRHQDLQVDFVSLDNAGAMRLAIEHLVAQGYRHMLYVTESVKGVSTREERASSFHRWIKEQREVDPLLTGRTLENSARQGEGLDEGLRTLYASAPCCQAAVITSNAVTSLRVVASMARLNLRLGMDIGLVGIDETEWAPYIGPGISTIAQPTGELGHIAASCLIERLKGQQPPPRQILLSGELIRRGSSLTHPPTEP